MSDEKPRPEPAPKVKVRRPKSTGPRVEGGGAEARKSASAILSVLGGACTPAQAAAAVGVTLPRYFAMESRALEGLVAACEPRAPGRKRTSPEKEVAQLRREVERLTRENTRRQALVRAAQRAAGVGIPETKPSPGKKRPKRPAVRALKAVAVLRSDAAAAPVTSAPQAAPPAPG